MPIQPVPHNPYGFSHCKCCQHSPNAQAFQVAKEEKRHSGGNGQANYVKRNFNDRIPDVDDLSQFSREKIGWNDRQMASVWQRNAETDQQIAHHKIENAADEMTRQNADPLFMKIY